MPFLQPSLTRIASGAIQAGTTTVEGTDLYLVAGGGGGGGSTVTAPFRVNMADGYAIIAEDPGLNTGIQVYRDQVLGGNARSYMNAVCVDVSEDNLSYGGFAHENDGTNLGLFTQFYGTDASLNLIGSLTFVKSLGTTGGALLQGGQVTPYQLTLTDSSITLGEATSVAPNVRILGSTGSGQVFDNIYNNPNLPTYSSVLGAGAQTQNTPAGGAYTQIVAPFAVDAQQYYRVSLAGFLSSSSNNGLMALIIKFNTTADQVILQSLPSTTSTISSCSTIEFRVPTGNTTMTIGVQGYNGFGGSDVATGGWTSLSIVQLN
jgi:hypothetical protein